MVVMTIMTLVILFFGDIYNIFCVRRAISGLCPAKKMSCIGKYQRNVLNWNDTVYIFVYFCMGALVNLFCVSMFTKFETILQPEMIFFLSTLFWVTLLELPFLYLTIKLNTTVIPCVKVVPIITEFYVLKPSLEPRRMSLDTPRTPLVYDSVLCRSQESLNVFKSRNCEKSKIKSGAFSRLQSKRVHGELSLLQTINMQNTHMGKGKSKGQSIGKGKGKITPMYISPKYRSIELTERAVIIFR